MEGTSLGGKPGAKTIRSRRMKVTRMMVGVRTGSGAEVGAWGYATALLAAVVWAALRVALQGSRCDSAQKRL